MLPFRNTAARQGARQDSVCWRSSLKLARQYASKPSAGSKELVASRHARERVGNCHPPVSTSKNQMYKYSYRGSNRMFASQNAAQSGMFAAGMRHFSTTTQIFQAEAAESMPSTESFRHDLRAWEKNRLDSEARKNQKPLQSMARKKLAEFQATINSASDEDKAALGQAFAKYTMGSGYGAMSTQDFEELDEELSNFNIDSADSKPEDEQTAFTRPENQPGDLIAYMADDQLQLGLFVRRARHPIYSKQDQAQVITSRGTWTHVFNSLRSPITWTIRKFVEPKELAEVLKCLPAEVIPESQLKTTNPPGWYLPYEVSRPLAEKLADFERRVEVIWRNYASRIDNAFDLVAKPHESTWWKVEDIARVVLQKKKSDKLSQEELYVVHRSCLVHNVGFYMERNHATTQLFEVYSRQDGEVVEQVRKWVREYSEQTVQKLKHATTTGSRSILERFADEVRPIIIQSRRARAISGDRYLAPSKEQLENLSESQLAYKTIQGAAVSSSTSMILRFLELFLGRQAGGSMSGSLSATCVAVVRSIGLYDGQNDVVKPTTDMMVLKECGIIPPWQSLADHEPDFIDPYSKRNPLMAPSLRGALAEGDGGELLSDTQKEYRHDWGDMPVFCIDAASTIDVDDGISLEACSEPDTYWIHVHIANPTAFIPIDSQTAEFARRSYSTSYLADRIDRMLPHQATSARLSLGKDRPTLTISTKVNGDGILLDRQIRNGFIRNVHRLTPEAVEQILGRESSTKIARSWSVGKIPRQLQQHDSTSITPTQDTINILQTIGRLGLAWEENIKKGSHRDWAYVRPCHAAPSVYHMKPEEPNFDNFRSFIGDPTIVYTAGNCCSDHHPLGIAGRVIQGLRKSLVEVTMVMANYSAARWCHERGIPVTFAGESIVGFSSHRAMIQELVNRLSQPFTNLRQWTLDSELLHELMKPTTILSTRPERHEGLHLDGYCTVTSPLRRYTDMLAHYQIESAIRAEVKLGRKFTDTDNNELVLSEEMVRKFITDGYYTMRRSRLRKNKIQNDWQRKFLIRAAVSRECADFPVQLTIYIINKAFDMLQCNIAELGTVGNFNTEIPSQYDEVEVGQVWKAKINQDELKFPNYWIQLVERIE